MLTGSFSRIGQLLAAGLLSILSASVEYHKGNFHMDKVHVCVVNGDVLMGN